MTQENRPQNAHFYIVHPNGPYPVQLVVVMAVRNAVSAATNIFTAISIIFFFMLFRIKINE